MSSASRDPDTDAACDTPRNPPASRLMELLTCRDALMSRAHGRAGGLDEGPVDRRPGERVRQGWRTPGFRAKRDCEAMKAQEWPCGLQSKPPLPPEEPVLSLPKDRSRSGAALGRAAPRLAGPLGPKTPARPRLHVGADPRCFVTCRDALMSREAGRRERPLKRFVLLSGARKSFRWGGGFADGNEARAARQGCRGCGFRASRCASAPPPRAGVLEAPPLPAALRRRQAPRLSQSGGSKPFGLFAEPFVSQPFPTR